MNQPAVQLTNSTDQYSGQYSGQSAGVEAVRQVTDPETSSPERTSAFTLSGETGKDEHTAAPASSERVSAFTPSGETGKDEHTAAPASSERVSAFIPSGEAGKREYPPLFLPGKPEKTRTRRHPLHQREYPRLPLLQRNRMKQGMSRAKNREQQDRAATRLYEKKQTGTAV